MNQELEHQMLILWLNLFSAVRKYAEDQKTFYLSVEPWNCDSTEVKSVWLELTKPEHYEYLEESLAVNQKMLTDPRLRELNVKWTQAALEECKLRKI